MPTANRGEVWVADLRYVAKTRPCLVLSVPFGSADRAVVTLVAHTTSVRGSDFEVIVSTSFLKVGAFDAQNILTVSNTKLLKKIGTLSANELHQVETAVLSWLGFWREPRQPRNTQTLAKGINLRTHRPAKPVRDFPLRPTSLIGV
jgi:mRNA interferase MazF